MKKLITNFLLVLGMLGFSFGMSNPASWYCTNHGGKEVTKKHSDWSQYTLCVFDNWSSCEEWAFYNGKCSKRTGSRVDIYCENHGGTVDGNDCVFDHGKRCDKADFYNHKCSKYHPQPPKPVINPAKKYCKQMGGMVESKQDDSGYSYDLCHLPSGVECGLWQYYNGTCHNPPNNSNPASRYCNQQWWTLDIWQEASGWKYGVCKFDDGSECEVWDFFQWRCEKGDYRFNRQIKNKVDNVLKNFYKNATHQHLLDALKNVHKAIGNTSSSDDNYGIYNHIHESLKKANQSKYYWLWSGLEE